MLSHLCSYARATGMQCIFTYKDAQPGWQYLDKASAKHPLRYPDGMERRSFLFFAVCSLVKRLQSPNRPSSPKASGTVPGQNQCKQIRQVPPLVWRETKFFFVVPCALW